MRAIHVASVIALCATFGAAGAWLGSRPSTPSAPPPDWKALVDSARSTAEAGGLRASALEVLDGAEDPVALAEAIEILGLVGLPEDAELLESFARSRDPVLGIPALRALGRLGTDEAVEVLISLLDPPTAERWVVVDALGRSRNPRALPWLQKLLRDPELRDGAAFGLAEYGTPEAAAILTEAFRSARDSEIAAPTRALARMASSDPEVERLLHATIDGPRTVRRSLVLASLAEVRDPLIFDALVVDLREGPGPISVQAAAALGALQDPRAIRPLREQTLIGASEVRSAAIAALAAIDTPEALEVLLDLAERSSPAIASHAVMAIQRLDEPRIVERLIALARISGLDLRMMIASQLLARSWPQGGVQQPVLDFARELLGDPNASLAASPIGLLLQHGGPEDWALVEKAILDRPALRASAIWPIQRSASPEADRLLRMLAEDPDPTVRQPALSVLLERGQTALVEQILLDRSASDTLDFGSSAAMLVQLGTDRAIEAVLDRIRNGTSGEWSGALNAVASGGSKAQVERVLQIADQTDNPALRSAILSSLVYSDNVDLMALVERATRVGTAELDGAAAQALIRLGTPEARDRLVDLAGHERPETRQAALLGLASVGGPEAESALIDALQDPDIAWAAVNGLQQIDTTAAREALADAARGRSVSPAVRLSALTQIAYLGGVDRTAILDEAIRDPDGLIRSSAIAALENVGTSEAAETLATVVGSRSAAEEDRRLAAGALQRMGGQVAERNRSAIEDLLPGDTGP